jgi:hypothetical protein
MTLGELRYGLKLLIPEIGIELLDTLIDDTYQDILDRIDWQREDRTIALSTVAPESTGTVTVTKGSNVVTGAGTAFSSSHTGAAFQINARGEVYEATYVSSTGLTLDRAYEGESGSGLSYYLLRWLIALPANVRRVSTVRLMGHGELPTSSRAGLRAVRGEEPAPGEPRNWGVYHDDASTPPRVQIELAPAPDAVYGLELEVGIDAPRPTGTGPGQSLVPWMRPDALKLGVEARWALRFAQDRHASLEAAYERAVATMAWSDAKLRGHERLRMHERYTRHRRGIDPRSYNL